MENPHRTCFDYRQNILRDDTAALSITAGDRTTAAEACGIAQGKLQAPIPMLKPGQIDAPGIYGILCLDIGLTKTLKGSIISDHQNLFRESWGIRRWQGNRLAHPGFLKRVLLEQFSPDPLPSTMQKKDQWPSLLRILPYDSGR